MSHLRLFFGAAVFLAAFLLFLVEPIAAKQLLPMLGGSASVWITCLVFFQSALLLGYLYAHWMARKPRWEVHFALLVVTLVCAVVWAVRPIVTPAGADHPIEAVFSALTVTIGIPFLMLAATSPLLQVWWSRTEGGAVPYRLYALSNLASFLALAAYPSLLEPYLTLHAQRVVWCCGFVAFTVLSAWLAHSTRSAVEAPSPAEVREADAPPAHFAQKVLWVLLPMAASMQLSAVTVHLTANIAAIPLLWILPLAVYLLTVVLAFQFPRLLAGGILVRLLVLVLASVAYMLSKVGYSWPIGFSIPFFIVVLFVACLFLHAQAYAVRPQRSSETTLFYLLFAAGGALGSFFVGILSPLVFRFNYDLPITFVITALLVLAATWRTQWSQRLLWTAASAAMIAVLVMVHIAYQHDTLFAVRNFYGALRVTQDQYTIPGATLRILLNGSIQHGTQMFGTDALRHTPTTYYAADSGVGYALRFCCGERARNIGIIGLGAGTIAAYGRRGDHIRFYEINPAVEPIARNVFTYMRESAATIDVVPGDGRTSLARSAPQNFDVLVVDAFSGDAIPLHLLTTQAMALYRHHLAAGGVIAFHISNLHVNLAEPIALLASNAGMQARRVSSLRNDARGEFTATWILVSDNAEFFAQPEVAAHGCLPLTRPGQRVWTDDYSALLAVLRW